MDKLYKDKDWLEQKYWNEILSTPKIAKLCGVGISTIRREIIKLKIKRRNCGILKGCHFSKETKEKMSRNHADISGEKNPMWGVHRFGKDSPGYGHKKSEKFCEEISKIMKRWHKNNPHPKGMLGRKHSEKTKREQSENHKGINNANFGKRWTKEQKNRSSKFMKNLIQNNPKLRKEMIERLEKACKRRPTNPEKVFDELTPEYVRYVGNGKWWRNHHNPDFKVTGQNKVIEIYGDYWHRNDNPEDRIREYKEMNLDCIVFWEHEVYKEPERILKEVEKFILI